MTNYEFEIIDKLSWTRGSHNIKTGVEINPRRIRMDSVGGIVYTFTNVQNFLANTPSQVQYTGDLNASPSPFHGGVISDRVGTQYFLGAYIQDEWRIPVGPHAVGRVLATIISRHPRKRTIDV